MTTVNIHASCVVLGRAAEAFGAPSDAGILLLGESAAGKSAVALQLIGRGARLVADDRVELFLREGEVWARAPAALAGLIEARGVGIVALPFAPEARVALAVELVSARDVPRLPERRHYAPPAALRAPQRLPPLLALSADDGAIVDKIGLAAAAFAHALFREESNPPQGLP